MCKIVYFDVEHVCKQKLSLCGWISSFSGYFSPELAWILVLYFAQCGKNTRFIHWFDTLSPSLDHFIPRSLSLASPFLPSSIPLILPHSWTHSPNHSLDHSFPHSLTQSIKPLLPPSFPPSPPHYPPSVPPSHIYPLTHLFLMRVRKSMALNRSTFPPQFLGFQE